MELDLAGEVVVVTGAAHGMGRAIASAFAAEGAIVALIDRDPSVTVAAELLPRSPGAETLGLPLDVTDYEALKELVRSLRERFGRCDHVVHAAAIGSGKFGFPFWSLEPADWDRVLSVNLKGA
ncbi:MAG TPA: SDR family oxidoreductase, partial [Isosphaeraceae bacterium]|nr:SDR family oxidoreductase [Isosphaeraceae bacterium]